MVFDEIKIYVGTYTYIQSWYFFQSNIFTVNLALSDFLMMLTHAPSFLQLSEPSQQWLKVKGLYF